MKPATASPITADPRWARVLARDAAADGSFFYAVSTTGVFCRPSCGARTARPEHVRFYPTAAHAEAAGYRPCKPCRPDAPPLAERHAALVADLCRRIHPPDTPPKLADLADAASLTPHHLVEDERVRMVIQRTWNRFLEGLAIRIMIVIYMLAYS